MIGKIRDTLVIFVALCILANVGWTKVYAQNYAVTPFVIVGTAPCKGNFVAVPGVTAYCFGTDMAEYSINGAAVTQYIPTSAAATPSLTINGVTKVLPGPFAISAPGVQ
jgi:hypothetical protein